jgi:hypothetical protein
MLLTHEWSTVFEILLVMGNTVAGQMMTGEIESMRSPEIILNCQQITPVVWDVACLISMFGKRDNHARWLIRKLECCLSARNEWLWEVAYNPISPTEVKRRFQTVSDMSAGTLKEEMRLHYEPRHWCSQRTPAEQTAYHMIAEKLK